MEVNNEGILINNETNELEKTEEHQIVRINKKEKRLSIRFCRLVIIFGLFAFLGWLYETLLWYSMNDYFIDIGFAALPICPIYGFTVVGMYLLVGTIDDPSKLIQKMFRKPIKKKWVKTINYAICAAIVVDGIELVTGIVFEHALGVRLWDYSHMSLNLWGYISLPTTIGWMLIIPIVMKFIFAPIYNKVAKFKDKNARIMAITIISLVSIDFIFNVIYIIATGNHFKWF